MKQEDTSIEQSNKMKE